MEELMDNLIPIGRFSRVTRLSVKALRRYADAGLLAPAWVDPSSGYRYYTYAQATQAEVIRVLRTLQMPLDEIGALLAAADDDAVAALLDGHRARLEAQLDHHSRMLAFLRRLIEEEGRPMPYDITLKEIPAQHVAVLRCRVTAQTIGDDVGRAFGTLMGAVGQAGVGFAGPPFLVMTEVVDTDGSGEGAIEVGIPVATPFAGLGEVSGELRPAHLVASTVHRGRYDEEGPAYAAVEQWVQEHGHASAGAPREVYLTSPADTPDPADYLTEIQFPIVVPD
jgi:DNA-binding transcriptional MerR regulator